MTNVFSSLFIRAITLILKFYFLIFITKNLSLEDFSNWILYFSIVMYSVLILGFEFYNITLRGYIQNKNKSNLSNLKIQFTTHFIVYLFLSVVGLIFFLNNKIVLSIIFIIILEHLTQEIIRISIYKNKQIFANLITFIKTGLWMLMLIIYFEYIEILNLFQIFNFWILGLIFASIVGLIKFNDLFFQIFKTQIKFKNFLTQLINLVNNSKYFIYVVIFYNFSFVFDKYYIEYILGEEHLSVYGFYSSVFNGFVTLYSVSVVAYFIPIFLKKQTKNKLTYSLLQCTKFSILYWILATISAYFLLPHLIFIVNKNYLEINIMYIFLFSLSYFLVSYGSCLNLILYSKLKDKSIAFGSLLFFLISLLTLIFLIPIYKIYGALFSIILSSLFLLIYRYHEIKKLLY